MLFGKFKVDMVTPETIKARLKVNKEKAAELKSVKSSKSNNFQMDEDLYEILKALRKKIADRNGKPPFTVFSNASLENMSALKPKTMNDFLEVHGVGEFKAKQFGKIFMDEIIGFEKLNL